MIHGSRQVPDHNLAEGYQAQKVVETEALQGADGALNHRSSEDLLTLTLDETFRCLRKLKEVEACLITTNHGYKTLHQVSQAIVLANALAAEPEAPNLPKEVEVIQST